MDRDPQFTACSFREAARILNVRLEYAGIQCPEDKPYIESFFGSYKTEELYRNEYNSLADSRLPFIQLMMQLSQDINDVIE